MTATLFRQIGPYVIERAIGHGGMASVFLAADTRSGRSVALKVVQLGTDEEAREILAAEQRGADLQRQFSAVSRYVPAVYESGFADDQFFIAMEYIAGEDLSQAIHRAPLSPERAAHVAIQLCDFLEEADRFETSASSRRVLLHNDLKPRNVRLMAGDAIKVLDFGAAKALSLSRKVTRNDFGSTPYLSPECLDTGERDTYSDAWALGVLLYEMVRGRQPFRAEDTRRLEQRIRSRQPPESLTGYCPPGLQAVIAKLLAPYAEDRYKSAADIRADLLRFQSGAATAAETEGWPARAHDEPPTRRTQPPMSAEPVTRATKVPAPPPSAGVATLPQPPGAAATPPAPPVPAPKRRRLFRWLRNGAVAVLVMMMLNEGCVATQAGRLAETVPMQELGGLTNIWTQYDSLASRSSFGGLGVRDLKRALQLHSAILAERVIENYKSPQPTVRENQWKGARDVLRRALAVSPNESQLRAALRYCEGHLHRIDGEAKRSRRQIVEAQEDFTHALMAFREAASLRPRWPDPFLGLARTFIYGLEDVDRGAEALKEAERLGYAIGDRETAQLADGFRARGDTLSRTADQLRGMSQEREYLERAVKAYREALAHYSKIVSLSTVASSLRAVQARIDRIERRLAEIDLPGQAARGPSVWRRLLDFIWE